MSPLHRAHGMPLACQQVFSGSSSVIVRTQKVANYYVEKGQRSDLTRGFMFEERPIEEFNPVTEHVIQRILSDWHSQHGFSTSEVQRIYQTHQALSPQRTKFLTVENTDGSFFSGLRIYDSSPVMKDRGQRWRIEGDAADRREISERVFANHRLSDLFSTLGLKRERHTWSLGLLDISESREKALNTLLAQAADLLDLHYNNREFFNFNNVGDIQRDDVDIIFYSNARLKQFYQRVLKVGPLKDARGQELVFSPKVSSGAPSEFFIFHLKGSAFIERFFKLEYHEPMFSSNKAMRRHEELHQYIRAKIKPHYDKLNPADFQVRDLPELLKHVQRAAEPFLARQRMSLPPDEGAFWYGMAQLFMLRKNIPSDVYASLERPEVMKEIRAILASPIGNLMVGGDGHKVDAGSLVTVSLLAHLDLVLQDPMLYLMNRMHIKEGP